MYGKVVAPYAGVVSFAKLARAVERIDDPDSIGADPARIICRLLREDGIVHSTVCNQLHNGAVRISIARGAERIDIEGCVLHGVRCCTLAESDQQFASEGGGLRCDLCVEPVSHHQGSG